MVSLDYDVTVSCSFTGLSCRSLPVSWFVGSCDFIGLWICWFHSMKKRETCKRKQKKTNHCWLLQLARRRATRRAALSTSLSPWYAIWSAMEMGRVRGLPTGRVRPPRCTPSSVIWMTCGVSSTLCLSLRSPANPLEQVSFAGSVLLCTSSSSSSAFSLSSQSG